MSSCRTCVRPFSGRCAAVRQACVPGCARGLHRPTSRRPRAHRTFRCARTGSLRRPKTRVGSVRVNVKQTSSPHYPSRTLGGEQCGHSEEHSFLQAEGCSFSSCRWARGSGPREAVPRPTTSCPRETGRHPSPPGRLEAGQARSDGARAK